MPSSVLVRVVFGVLVLATSAAFLVAQRLKRSTPIVEGVSYNRYISPTCGCRKSHVRIYFTLRDAGRVTATMVNSGGDDVRTLVDDRRLNSGRHSYVWRGHTDSGAIAPDGQYRLRVTLRNQARSVTAARVVIVDTVGPRPHIRAVTPAEIVPGGSGTVGRARISFRGNSHARPLVQIYRTDLSKVVRVASFHARRGRHTAFWKGMIDGRPAPDGIYSVTITTFDKALNKGSFPPVLPPTRSEVKPGTGVSVRYLTIGGSLDPVRAGSLAHFRIGPLGRRLRWSLGPVGPGTAVASGGGSGRRLTLRVPSSAASGMYLLRVRAGGHHAVQPVVVQGAKHGSVLVVVPAIAWQGGNPVDDDGDGFANTLSGGEAVNIDRPFAHGQPPAGLTDKLGPLLRFLARQHVPYEITTDLALAQNRGPRIAGHSGVMFVGDETWLTDRLDLALRNYVDAGGRVASFGTDAFRRRVGLAAGQLLDPGAPERFNVFGEQVGEARIQQAPMVVNQPDTLGLFSDVAGGLFGEFDQFEQSQRLVGGAQVLSSAGRDPKHPAFVAYRLGKGIVVRVGTPEWGQKLSGDVELTDVTRRVWSLLSR